MSTKKKEVEENAGEKESDFPGCVTEYDLYWDERVLDAPHYELFGEA